jgi:transposase
MQNYTTIIGIIDLRLQKCSYDVVQKRYSVGSSTVTLIMKRFGELGLPFEDLRQMEPQKVETAFYPPTNNQRKDIPIPDFQKYYDHMMKKGSKMNLFFLWIEYKQENPDGYQTTQFYEYFNRFVKENYGGRNVTMPVERIPGEKIYIDWVGDKPELLTDPETGEILPVHIFVTTLGVSSLVYAEAFLDEKLSSFVAGTVHAIQFYGGVTKYLVPDNCATAVKKHSKDELVLNSVYQDLEDFYDTILLPPPPRKPKGKATVENHVKYLETHLLERLKEGTHTSLKALNDETLKIIAVINRRQFQKKAGSRQELYEKYDKPHMKPLPGESYTTCDYKYFLKIPDNYHLEYDGHYYSVLYTYHGQPAILKATLSEIRICDRNNRLICKHQRSYKGFPLYITDDSHMKPEHLYYKETNARDGAYYRRWASVFGPYMSELIDTVLRSARHEEQSYNSCSGILHSCKDVSKALAEEAAHKCVEMHACKYTYFKKVLSTVVNDRKNGIGAKASSLPEHENIRGKGFYR